MPSIKLLIDGDRFTYIAPEYEKKIIDFLSQSRRGNGEISHDTWSLYSYGTKYKLVYFKTGNKPRSPPLEGTSKPDNVRFRSSLSRTKSTVFEIAMCNEFQFFCTFTQDEKLRGDRYNLGEFRKAFSQFIRNENKKRDTPIKYLCIPEQHKDGAWHLHGLLSGLIVGKDLVKNKYNYYDWTAYSKRFGFFSCDEIKNSEKCSSYICKYITKEFLEKEENSHQHLFFASQGLARKQTLVNKSFMPLFDWNFDWENDYVGISWIDGDIAEKITSLHFMES